jgi:hypothetical protein
VVVESGCDGCGHSSATTGSDGGWQWWRGGGGQRGGEHVFFFQKCLPCAVARRTTKKMNLGFLGPAFLCRALFLTHGTFAVRAIKNARQSSFTVKNLSCGLCRAFIAICRASETHGKRRFSRSAPCLNAT